MGNGHPVAIKPLGGTPALEQNEALLKQSAFDRHHYLEDPDDLQGHDKSNPPLIWPEVGFRCELGGQTDDSPYTLEEVEKHSLYYKENFACQEHFNFVGGNASNPFVVSIVQEDRVKGTPTQWKVLIRNKTDDLHYAVTAPTKGAVLKVLQAAVPGLSDVELLEVKDPALAEDLRHMEDRLLIKAYRFGVVYCKQGQTDENDMFSNKAGSKEFHDFMDFLGEKVKLKGYKGFRGGLDVNENTTGTHSYAGAYNNFDIMYHVSTCLPFSEVNPQQVERKRHIGNDVVVIVFQDGPTGGFRPTTIQSKFNHVYIVVQVLKDSKSSRGKSKSPSRRSSNPPKRGRSSSRESEQVSSKVMPTKRPSKKNLKKASSKKEVVSPIKGEKESVESSSPKYKVAIISKHGVKPHGPVLPEKKVWSANDDFKEFLLTKMVNAERAAYYAPGFAQQRTRRLWLKDLLEKYSPQTKK